jgi:hypothetical protein
MPPDSVKPKGLFLPDRAGQSVLARDELALREHAD